MLALGAADLQAAAPLIKATIRLVPMTGLQADILAALAQLLAGKDVPDGTQSVGWRSARLWRSRRMLVRSRRLRRAGLHGDGLTSNKDIGLDGDQTRVWSEKIIRDAIGDWIDCA